MSKDPLDGDQTTVGSEDFWRFSLRLYALDGVQEACLSLQDAHEADVTLVLFALWVGFRHGAVDADAEARAAAVSADWAARAVRPLRAIRRDLKRGVDGVEWAPLRDRVKALELEAERAQHAALQAIATQSPANARRGVSPTPEDACMCASRTFDRLATLTGLAVRSAAPAFQTLLRCAESLDDDGSRP